MLWKNYVKNTFCLDPFCRKFYALEFSDAEDLEFIMEKETIVCRGQIIHLERLITQFSDMDAIIKLVVWAMLPRVPVQYKEAEIIKVAAQPLGKIVRVNELLYFNGLFVKVFVGSGYEVSC